MKRRTLLGFLAAAFAPLSAPVARAAAAPQPPATPKRPVRIDTLGRTRTDDYAWLKPANWKQVWRDNGALDPTIRAHLAEEDAYASAILAPSAPIQGSCWRR